MHTSIYLCFLNEKAFRFYDNYAERSGFSICKGEFIKKNGMIHMKYFMKYFFVTVKDFLKNNL